MKFVFDSATYYFQVTQWVPNFPSLIIHNKCLLPLSGGAAQFCGTFKELMPNYPFVFISQRILQMHWRVTTPCTGTRVVMDCVE